MTTEFSYLMHTERFWGSKKVVREIFVQVSNHPKVDDNCLESLSVEEVKALRDMCNEILEEVKYEDERFTTKK